VEQHRHNEDWIEAAEKAQEIPPLIETAELSEEQEATLRQFVATQEQDRDEWAEERWVGIKDEADACVDDQRYLDASEHLDDLKAVAPYTPFESETADFVEEVEEKADLEKHYRRVVQSAIEEAEVLRQDRVDPEKGKAVESAIETAEEAYRALYGGPDLPERPPLEKDALPLTIDQKLGLALQLRALAENSPTRDAAEALTDELRDRRTEVQALSLDDRDGLDLVEDYPDHPDAEAALDELLNEELPFWALPSHIRRARSVIEEYRDYISEERLTNRIRELERRAAVFEWGGEGSAGAISLIILGLFFSSIGVLTENLGPGIVGSLIVGSGLLLQYTQARFQRREQTASDESTSSKSSDSLESEESEEGGREDKREKDWSERRGHPAGIWHCPNCGNETAKEAGTIGTACRSCGSKMEYGKAPFFSGGCLTFLAFSFVVLLVIMLAA
jgi:hypothetical protein